MKLKDKILIFILVILVLFVVALVYGVMGIGRSYNPLTKIISHNSVSVPNTSSQTPAQSVSASSKVSGSCPIETTIDTVNGGSMSGVVENGQQITVLKNYYSCHDVQRNDVVIYNYAGNQEPLIKIVRAIPGDAWKLKLASQGYEIIVNDKILTAASGHPYQIPTGNIKMLKLYASNYPIIPKDAYLILGNLPQGSLDGSRFGLIGKADIIGKVILK